MSVVAENISSIKGTLPKHVTLVAVSKTKPNEDILEAYKAKQNVFGENKVQDLVKKFEELPREIEWHFIGHLQTNKVKFLAPFVSLIHAVDSLKLLKEINKEGRKNERIINCLLQCKIASEDSKFGLSKNDLLAMLDSSEFEEMNHINIKGVMGMATFTDNKKQVRQEFKNLYKTFHQIKEGYFKSKPDFEIISMGMSHDYKIAIEEGATMIRVGSSIFGERNYNKTS